MKVKMKKRDRIVLCIWIVICIVLYALLVRSCARRYARRYTPSAARREEIRETFEALPHTDSYALVRYDRWIIRGETYELDDPLYLDETGFFSASYVLSPVPTISFYHTEFEDMERELLGSAPLPSPYSPSFLWYSDGNFYYRADTPRGEEGGYEYRTYRWNVNDQVAVETDEDYPSAIADRESDYEFDFDGFIGFSTFRWYKRVKVTEKSTGITKTVDKKTLKTFPEGKTIYRLESSERNFIAAARIISGDDIYFIFRFAVGIPVGQDVVYFYIVKWNFQTEECSFVATVDAFESGVDYFVYLD